MSQLPNPAHQLLTNLTPITIDGQTVYIAQVRSDANYAIGGVGNIVTSGNIVTAANVNNLASIQSPGCPENVQQNIVTQGNVLVQGSLPVQPNVVSVSSPVNVPMATTTHKQEPISSPPSYMKGVNVQGHKVTYYYY